MTLGPALDQALYAMSNQPTMVDYAKQAFAHLPVLDYIPEADLERIQSILDQLR